MNTIYLLSGPLKNTGFPSKIKKLLKNDLKNKKSIAFIPTTPNDYKKNDLYVYGDNKNILGLNSYLKEISSLEYINIIDNRISFKEAQKIIKETDIIYLLGGNPFNQLDYLKQKKYDTLIKNFTGIIIGTSAGAMNLAKEAYYSKDEDFNQSIFYNALNIIDITIDPHFEINNKEQVKEIIKNSNNKTIIGLPNESGIRITENKIEFINKCYQFNNQNMKEIN